MKSASNEPKQIEVNTELDLNNKLKKSLDEDLVTPPACKSGILRIRNFSSPKETYALFDIPISGGIRSSKIEYHLAKTKGTGVS